MPVTSERRRQFLDVRHGPPRLRPVLGRTHRFDPVVPDADGGDRLAALFADRQRARSRPRRPRAVRADAGADLAGRPCRRPLRPPPHSHGVPGGGGGCGRGSGARHAGGWLDPIAIYVVTALVGAARAFEIPTMVAIIPALVPRPLVPAATAWFATANQAGQIVGPVLGGLLYGLRPGPASFTAPPLACGASARRSSP